MAENTMVGRPQPVVGRNEDRPCTVSRHHGVGLRTHDKTGARRKTPNAIKVASTNTWYEDQRACDVGP
eukprot:4503073-Lingulodinium_polyedra.AAC.1